MQSVTALLLLLLAHGVLIPVQARKLYDNSDSVDLVPRSKLVFVESPEASKRLPKQRAGYLYPILSWGPNNQVAGLKEVLALGRLLKRTVIVHDIINHYDEQQQVTLEGGQLALGPDTTMPFDLVFDFDHLSRHQSVVRQSELLSKSGGWDGVLDAVVHFDDAFLPQIKNAIALNVTDDGADYVKFPAFNCSKGELAAMVKKLERYKYVGVIVYEHVVQSAGHGVKLYMTGDACHDEFLQVTAQLTKSKQIIQLAKDFREKRLGNQSYIAVHIRPYPDKCLYVWRHPELKADEKMAKKMCKNPRLIKVFVGQTLHAMKTKLVDGLFVMSYPSIRDRITELYGTKGLKPVFFDEDDLEAAIGYKSVSLLGMVEEEIALEAKIFIGTSYSSMTGIISQERFAHGVWPGNSKAFTKTT